MYHCHLQFYFAGPAHPAFEIIKKIPPLANFTHAFSESSQPDPALAAQADVTFLNLTGLDVQVALNTLLPQQKERATLILLAGRDQIELIFDHFPTVTDIWTLPLSGAEIRFRFLRWQQQCFQEKEAWQTSQYLEAAINSIPSLIWYKSRDGIHEKVNDSFCKTVNKTREQVQGRGHAYIWDVEQDDPACIESERKVMESRQTCVSEEMVQTGEDARLLTTYKSPLYDLDGSVMGTVGVGIDITRERAYQQELLQKNRTLETIFTTMDCGVIRHSLDGSTVLSINQAALNILGYDSPSSMLAAGFHMMADSVLGEDKPRLAEAIQSLTRPGDSVTVTYRVLHRDGTLLYIMGNIKLMEEDGELIYQRFLLDCTAQKLREQQERTENDRRQMELVHALIVDYNFVCYFDLDSGLGIPLHNTDTIDPVFVPVFPGERSFYDNIADYAKQYVYPEDRETLLNAYSAERLEKELTRKKTFYMNYRACVDENVQYYQIKAVRAGSWAEHRGVVLGFRNVDDETRSELEKKTLLEDALLTANRASKAKSVFLSNMSHDIRTPMNAIVGFTTLAITHIDRQEQVMEYLKKILTSGNHLVSLINDVLDMSRIESGKMHLDEALCSLPDILHGLRNIVQADIHAKQLELYIDAVDVIDEEIYCDKLRLNQVLLNLLSNSIKYTGAGGIVSVRIRETTGAPAGFANYEFRIKDNGIGMSEEFVSHIFEPFEREQNSTISGIQGTGLGMAITRNIVDMMHGSIEVHSKQGEGTEFIVSLTFRLSAEPPKPQVIPSLKNCRALVVDDDFNTCDSVTYMLQQIGLRAEWTLSGREAVLRTRQAVSRGDNYSVYLIDWLMPDMNGIEVARRIRKETGENVPIIVLTAYDWADIEEEAREAGITGFCSKPLFLSELRNCLYSVVDAGKCDSSQTGMIQIPVHTGRILLAEDNELNQEIAVEILSEAGFTTEVAENGQAALEMLENAEPGYYQLILMDVQMPVMDGYTATRKIRSLKDHKRASIPILAMTANAFEEDRRDALKCGMNGHIAKPIDIDTLFEALNEILR